MVSFLKVIEEKLTQFSTGHMASRSFRSAGVSFPGLLDPKIKICIVFSGCPHADFSKFPRRFLWDHRLDLRINLLNCGRFQPRCGPFGSEYSVARRTPKITTYRTSLQEMRLRVRTASVSVGERARCPPVGGLHVKSGREVSLREAKRRSNPTSSFHMPVRLLRFARNDKKEDFGVPRPPHEHDQQSIRLLPLLFYSIDSYNNILL